MKPTDSYAIAALMMQAEGWERTGGRCNMPLYGRQRLYRRCPAADQPLGGEIASTASLDFLN